MCRPHGTVPLKSFPHGGYGAKFFACRGKAAADAACDFDCNSAFGKRPEGEIDRPVRPRIAADGCRPRGAGIRAAISEFGIGPGKRVARTAGQLRRAAQHWSERIDLLVFDSARPALPAIVSQG